MSHKQSVPFSPQRFLGTGEIRKTKVVEEIMIVCSSPSIWGRPQSHPDPWERLNIISMDKYPSLQRIYWLYLLWRQDQNTLGIAQSPVLGDQEGNLPQLEYVDLVLFLMIQWFLILQIWSTNIMGKKGSADATHPNVGCFWQSLQNVGSPEQTSPSHRPR